MTFKTIGRLAVVGALGLSLSGCVTAMVTGAVVGTAVGVTGAAVKTAAKGTGMVVGAVIPGGGDKDEKKKR